MYRLLAMDSTFGFPTFNIWDVPEQSKCCPNTWLFFLCCTIYAFFLILFSWTSILSHVDIRGKCPSDLEGPSYGLSPVCAAPHLPCSGHYALNLLLCLSPQKITPISQLKVIFSWEIGQKWVWNKREGDACFRTWDWIFQKLVREFWHCLIRLM